MPKKYCIIGILSSSFDGAELILLLPKSIELILHPRMIIFYCITFQKYNDFSLFQNIKRLFDVAGVEVISLALGKADLFVEFLTKSKSKQLI